jgi:hypothetical protein
MRIQRIKDNAADYVDPQDMLAELRDAASRPGFLRGQTRGATADGFDCLRNERLGGEERCNIAKQIQVDFQVIAWRYRPSNPLISMRVSRRLESASCLCRRGQARYKPSMGAPIAQITLSGLRR